MRTLLVFFTILLFNNAYSQNLFSTWEGKPLSLDLRLRFTFEQNTDGSVTGKMDSPDQNAFDVKMDNTIIKSDSVYTELKQIGFSFHGKLVNDTTLSGMISQGGATLPINLYRTSKAKTLSVKPQTPVPPYPYNSEDVLFAGGHPGIQIGGTITYPKSPGSPGKYPAILLIGGSGPSDRDHTLFGHKPFAVLAEHLTKNGFLVLRVDDRGVGKSTGNYKGSTTADFNMDASAAINYLKSRPEVNISKIGIAGHSEGGMIAPMVAAERNDIAFLVLLAAPGIEIKELMKEQSAAVFASGGADQISVKEYGNLYKGVMEKLLDADDSTKAIKKGRDFIEDWAEDQKPETLAATGLTSIDKRNAYVNQLYNAITDTWFRYFIEYDPGKSLRKLNTKVLAINGDKDVQVISTSNLEGIRSALSKSKSPEPMIVLMPGHNHLLQRCQTCTVQEYGKLDESFSPDVMNLITEWLKKFL